MPWTLQRYIFREMGKTFLLAAAALTATMSLGGGVLKMVGVGELTPEQLVRLLVLIVPVSAALTLPVAALFSAAATYGRLSADNEFVACRSSGINLHVLFLPTLALSLGSAGATFAFWNYAIPGIIEHIDDLVARDAASLVRQRLNKPRGIALGSGLRLSADELVADPQRPEHLVLNDVVFVELQGEEWSRYGTARQLDIDVDLKATPAMVSARLVGISLYDRKAHRFVDIAEQVLPPTELPSMLPRQIKYLDLGSLVHFARNVEEWHQVEAAMDDLRVQIGRRKIIDTLEESLCDLGFVALEGGGVTLTLRSAKPPLRIPRDGGIELTGATIEERRDARLRTGSTDRAIIDVVRADTLDHCTIKVDAYDVQLTVDNQTISKSKETFGPVPFPGEIVERVSQMPAGRLFEPVAVRGERDPVAEKQALAQHQRQRAYLEIIGTINERTAFSVSVFVLVILAAALGIVFRGAHAVVAFGVSFIPSLFVIVAIIAGKQLTQNAETHVAGLGVLWGGIVLVLMLDGWTLWRVVRR